MPLNRVVPRSFFTNVSDGKTVGRLGPVRIRGIAFGGDCGVDKVELSTDRGQTCSPAEPGNDEGTCGYLEHLR